MKVQDYINEKYKKEVDFGEIEIAEGINTTKRFYTLESEDIDKIDLLLDNKYIITDTDIMAFIVDTKQLYICHGGRWFEI